MTDIAIVGEAWGAEEKRQRMPFVGPTGYELSKMLDEAGIRRADCFLTNCFNLQPEPTNAIENLCTDKVGGIPNRGPLSSGKYVRAQYAGELERLFGEIRSVRPNLIVALGGTASWALLGQPGISKIRGTVASSSLGFKCLPTYHPAVIFKGPDSWALRHLIVLDLIKARHESTFPDIRRPHRKVFIPDEVADLESFHARYLREQTPGSILSVDIETAGTQITCIGFAPSAQVCLVIPITDPRREGGSYWKTPADEGHVWRFIRRVLSNPARKLFQNGLYDMNFLWQSYHIPTTNPGEDTMLLHHALQPESEKGLGFLGSVYANEPAWKQMRTRGKTTIKKDE